jgi:hypothetical protein
MSYLKTHMSATGESSSPQKHHESIEKSGWWGAKVKLVVLVVGLMVGGGLLKGVEAQSVLRNYRPSPQAASLVEASGVQTDLSTGTVRFSKTLYVVETAGGIKLPITLKHNGQAVKPNRIPGRVGVGWTLSAGGVITRSVKGRPDDAEYGYEDWGYDLIEFYDSVSSSFNIESDLNNPDEVINPAAGGPSELRERLRNNREGSEEPEIDTSPDNYNYQYGGKSGGILIYPTDDLESTYEPIPIKDINVESPSQNYWKITDKRGKKYTFGSEGSTERTTYKVLDNPTRNSSYITRFSNVKTSWFLRQIESSSGRNTIKLYYKVDENVVHEKPPSKSHVKPLNASEHCITSSWYSRRKWSLTRQVQYDRKRLYKIVTEKEVIVFNSSLRKDGIHPENDPGSGVSRQQYKLDSINVYTNKSGGLTRSEEKGALKRKIAFSYSYFDTGQKRDRDEVPKVWVSGKKLRLDSVQVKGSSGNDKISYGFSYYGEQETLPGRFSRAVDHWGYPNGSNNNTIIPDTTICHQDNCHDFGGADRSPAEDKSDVRPGALKRVTYPTGGYTEFNYELRRYGSNLLEPKSGIAGGLRVSKIARADGNSSTPKNVRRFQYNPEGSSSGVLLGIPDYTYKATFPTYPDNADCVVGGASGSPMLPLGRGGGVWYTRVDVLHGPLNGDGQPSHGRTELRFLSPKMDTELYWWADSLEPIYPFAVVYPRSWKYGLGKSMLEKNGASQRIEKKDTSYVLSSSLSPSREDGERTEFYRNIGINHFAVPMGKYEPGGTRWFFWIGWHEQSTSFFHRDSVSVTHYGKDGNQSLSKTVDIDHFDVTHFQPTKKTVSTSNGLRRTTKYKYAHEEYPGMAYENMMTQKYRTTVSVDTAGFGEDPTVLKRSWKTWRTEDVDGDGSGEWVPDEEWIWTGTTKGL